MRLSTIAATLCALAAACAPAAPPAPTSAPNPPAVTPAAAAAATVAAATGTANVLRTAYQADIDSFDPDNGFEVAGLGAIMAVYQGLVGYAPSSTNSVGVLAKDFTISP